MALTGLVCWHCEGEGRKDGEVCPVCEGDPVVVNNPFDSVPKKRSRITCFMRALWLTLCITRRPWWDKEEPFCNISLKRAWEIAHGIWLK